VLAGEVMIESRDEKALDAGVALALRYFSRVGGTIGALRIRHIRVGL
jgi:hypothetical protein